MEERKTVGEKPLDRRTRYTRRTLKEALLELMQEKPYNRITVTEICRRSQINRGTFYLHYFDLDDLLDDLLHDAFGDTTDVMDHVLCPQEERCTYPFCQKVQGNPVYQPLFFDETVAPRIVNLLVEERKEAFVTKLMRHSALTFEQAEALLYFQCNGCLAINRMMLKNRCRDWKTVQTTIDRFLKGGLEAFLRDGQEEDDS